MRLDIALEARFARTPDGTVWTEVGMEHEFWQRYLDVFDTVRIVARVADVHAVPASYRRVDGPRVAVHALPHYIGPLQFLRVRPRLRRRMQEAVASSEVMVLRGPGPLAGLAIDLLRHSGKPYALEVVGDPHDVFAPGAVRHPLRSVFRWWFTRRQKQQCRGAAATLYVTERTLQTRYPTLGFSTHASNVELGDDAFAAAPRQARDRTNGPFRLVFVGSLAQLYKGPDVLLRAIRHCVDNGLPLHMTMIGDGQYRSQVESLIEQLQLSAHVDMLGALPAGPQIRAQLDAADLFVLPSRTEGLPRAMIEAMARGLPCIGTMVGGIPELLPEECLVPAGDAAALAKRIAELLGDPSRRDEHARRNLVVARAYHDTELQKRRTAFYAEIARRTSAWQVERASA